MLSKKSFLRARKIFSYKQVIGKDKKAYIVYSSANIKDGEINLLDKNGNFRNGFDRTAFESLENHVHITDKVFMSNFNNLCNQGELIGQLMLAKLKLDFPDKHFYVFVTIQIRESMIVRFHQRWENEDPWINVDDPYWQTQKGLKVFCFYN